MFSRLYWEWWDLKTVLSPTQVIFQNTFFKRNTCVPFNLFNWIFVSAVFFSVEVFFNDFSVPSLFSNTFGVSHRLPSCDVKWLMKVIVYGCEVCTDDTFFIEWSDTTAGRVTEGIQELTLLFFGVFMWLLSASAHSYIHDSPMDFFLDDEKTLSRTALSTWSVRHPYSYLVNNNLFFYHFILFSLLCFLKRKKKVSDVYFNISSNERSDDLLSW